MKYEYKVKRDVSLSPNATTPIPSTTDVEAWLNDMDKQGWEYVGNGQKFWHNELAQTFWVFRREIKPKKG